VAANDYVFVTLWRVPGNVDRAYRVLVDVENYPRWWSEVYLRVEPLTPLRKTIGDRVRLLTGGKLPYKIRWQSEIVQANPPHDFMIRATGDFDGRGIWAFKQQGNDVVLTFDWRLRAQKRLIRTLPWLFKPLFRWNHRWAMARGQEGLSHEMMSAR
jgi:polyketide cyclase/dehydrase/lipid transport protein